MEHSNRVVLVMGASSKVERYSNRAVKMLLDHGFTVKAQGRGEGEINGVPILNGTPHFEGLDTISLYLNPTNQQSYYDYILACNPKRVVFNPGTENEELQDKLTEQGIEWEEACTLVLLQTNQF